MTQPSSYDEIGNLLRGEQAKLAGKTTQPAAASPSQPQGKPDAASGKAPSDAPGLNQLSDVAEKMEGKPVRQERTPAPTPAVPASLPSQGFSQDPLIDAPIQLQFQQASQPDIPPPILPESQPQSQPMQVIAGLADDGKGGFNLNPASLQTLMMSQMGQMGVTPEMAMNLVQSGLDFTYMNPYNIMSTGMEDDTNVGSGKRSQGKKQTRRGPMDEMRQLVRILVKIFPQSIAFITSGDETGGGNRISEEQIKIYLEKTLGEAPRPTWGVPYGWNAYLAELFSWASGKTISPEDAKRVAKREPGRSWEAIETEMVAIGVHPPCWPLPLTLESVKDAQRNPVPQPIPVVAVNKPKDDGAAPSGAGAASAAAPTAPAPSRRGKSSTDKELEKMSEEQLWRHMLDVLNVASNKINTGDPTTVVTLKVNVKTRIDEMLSSAGLYQPYLPMMAGGIDQSMLQFLQNALPQSTAGMAQLGTQFDSADLQQMQQLVAQAGLPIFDPQAAQQLQQLQQAQQQMEQLQQQQQQQQQQPQGQRSAKRARKEDGGDPQQSETPPTEDEQDAAEKKDKTKAPLSSSEARGTLFGALGGGDGGGSDQAPPTSSAFLAPLQPGPPLSMPGFNIAGAYQLQIPSLQMSGYGVNGAGEQAQHGGEQQK